MGPALVFYPEVRLPANAEYLAGFDRFSKSVCEEVYLVSQVESQTGAFKAPEGQSVFSGVLNSGIAKVGFAATLAAAKKRANSASTWAARTTTGSAWPGTLTIQLGLAKGALKRSRSSLSSLANANNL